MAGTHGQAADSDSTGTVLPSVVAAYFRLLNADDLDAFPALWHPEPELAVFGRHGRRTLIGTEAVLAWYDGLFSPWSTHHDEVVGAAVADDTVTVEILFTGAMPDGRPVRFDALDVFHLVDDRIQRLAIWHDVLTTRRLLAPAWGDDGVTPDDPEPWRPCRRELPAEQHRKW